MRESEKRDEEIKNQLCGTTGVRHSKTWEREGQMRQNLSKREKFQTKIWKRTEKKKNYIKLS